MKKPIHHLDPQIEKAINDFDVAHNKLLKELIKVLRKIVNGKKP